MFIFGWIDEIAMIAAAFTAGANPTARAVIGGAASNVWSGIKSAAAYITNNYNPRKRG